MRGVVGHGHLPLEVVGTVFEMADVAWNALEHRRNRKNDAEDAARLLSENIHLRALLADNLALLHDISQAPNLSDCPPDLYKRLVAAVDDSRFLDKIESLRQESALTPDGKLPLDKATGAVFDEVDIFVNDHGEPSRWVWVQQDMDPDNLEEVSGIDNENYVVISEENVVDGIANFIARSILENPKSKVLTPDELQKTVTRALVEIKDRSKWKKVWEAGKIIYALSTWGIALAGLYRHRAVLKVAAKGVHTTTKLVMKAL